jgi:hypothetical protein
LAAAVADAFIGFEFVLVGVGEEFLIAKERGPGMLAGGEEIVGAEMFEDAVGGLAKEAGGPGDAEGLAKDGAFGKEIVFVEDVPTRGVDRDEEFADAAVEFEGGFGRRFGRWGGCRWNSCGL